MKKQAYMAPTTKVQKIELQQIMAGSGPQNVYSDTADGITDESKVLTRQGFSVWGEDEEEE